MTLATNNLTDEVGTGSPDFPNGMPTSAGDPIVERGSNSDGEWTRWADGTQYCGVSITLVYAAANIIATTWNFPVAFTGDQRPSHEPDSVSLSSTTPSLEDMGLTSSQGLTTSSVTLQQRRAAGATNFASGDTATTRATCFGLWK